MTSKYFKRPPKKSTYSGYGPHGELDYNDKKYKNDRKRTYLNEFDEMMRPNDRTNRPKRDKWY